MSKTIKECTASTFVFRQLDGGWLLGLIWHPRLDCFMLPGGHVEDFENGAEAALRENAEETGWKTRLVPGPSAELPAGSPHPQVPAPWWVQELPVAPDNHTREQHVHVDHLFIALAEGEGPVAEAAHEVRWFTAAEVAEHPEIAEDLRLQAKGAFAQIEQLAAA